MKKLLNDLYDYTGFKIYQYEEGFKFSLDSILLAEMVYFHKKDQNILDLCTGNAVIPLVLSSKTSLPIVGVELQKPIYDLARDSVLLNGKETQIKLINDSIKHLSTYFPGNNFDIITCNPPYFRYHNDNFLNHEKIKQIARHEVEIKLDEIISIASLFLKDKGYFYMVHIPERLQEIMVLLEQNHLRIKDLCFVYPKRDERAALILFRAMKRANMGMKVHSPIYLDEVSTYQDIFKDVIK